MALAKFAGSLKKFGEGNTIATISGTLDIVVGISEFLPPPASDFTQMISTLFDMFSGGGTPSLKSVILDEFENLKIFIVRELADLRSQIKTIVEKSAMDNLLRIAQGILSDLR